MLAEIVLIAQKLLLTGVVIFFKPGTVLSYTFTAQPHSQCFVTTGHPTSGSVCHLRYQPSVEFVDKVVAELKTLLCEHPIDFEQFWDFFLSRFGPPPNPEEGSSALALDQAASVSPPEALPQMQVLEVEVDEAARASKAKPRRKKKK